MQWEIFSHWQKRLDRRKIKPGMNWVCNACLIWVMDLFGDWLRIKNPWRKAVGLPDYIPKLNTNGLGTFWLLFVLLLTKPTFYPTKSNTFVPISYLLSIRNLHIIIVTISSCFLHIISPMSGSFWKARPVSTIFPHFKGPSHYLTAFSSSPLTIAK